MKTQQEAEQSFKELENELIKACDRWIEDGRPIRQGSFSCCPVGIYYQQYRTEFSHDGYEEPLIENGLIEHKHQMTYITSGFDDNKFPIDNPYYQLGKRLREKYIK